LGGLDALGDDHCHRVADMAHLALRQQRARRLLHRLVGLSRDAPGARHPVELVGGDVVRGEDRRDTGARQRLRPFSIATISASAWGERRNTA